jgi:RNA polymerase sigma-70 factor (ECF subfamily)
MSTLPAAELHLSSETAFAELYERNADRIYAYCRRRLRSRQEAEDAVQETFVAAMRAIKRGSVPVCESAWLYKIAENVCIAAYRSGARRQLRDVTDSERVVQLPARERDGEALMGLEAALTALPENQRRAFLLRELRGLSYREIAIQLGVSVASVETLIYRARRGLARGLESGAGLGRRLTAGLNVGSLVAAVKGWFAGAAVVKVASVATVAALASLAAGDVLDEPRRQSRSAVQPAKVTAAQPATVKQSVLRGTPRRAQKRPKADSPPTEPGARQSRPRTGARPGSPVPTTVTASAPPAAAGGPAAESPAAEPQGSAPTLPAPPEPVLPVVVPQPPSLPATEPAKVEIPDVTEVVGALPAVPALPPLPNPVGLLPEVPSVPEVSLPVVPKLP